MALAPASVQLSLGWVVMVVRPGLPSQGGRSYMNLAVCQPVTSGGTSCSVDNTHWAFGFGLLCSRCWAVHLLPGTGRPRRGGPGSELILLVQLLLGGVPAWRGSALGSVRTCPPPSGLSASPKLQLKVRTTGELPDPSATCGGSEEDWRQREAPGPWDPQTLEGGRDVVAPEVRVPVLREPRGEEGRLVPQSPAALFPVGLPGGPFLVPRGGSGIPSVLFPFSGLDHMGGDPMQDLRWEWAALRTPQPPALASMGLGGWCILKIGWGGGRVPGKPYPAPRPRGPAKPGA